MAAWTRKKKKGAEWLEAASLARPAWLVHAFTVRKPAEFNLNYPVAPAPAVVTRNRRTLLGALRSPRGRGRWQLITLKQRHTDIIQVLDATPRRRASFAAAFTREADGAWKLVGDAVITNRSGLLLAVQVADCLPILLVDPVKHVVAAVHAGWRGTARRVAEKTVGRMQQEFGCEPRRIRAAIGPGIHRCCYEVGREVVETFVGQFPYWEKLVARTEPSPTEVHWQQPLFSPHSGEKRPRPAVTAPAAEKLHLDLVEANRRQLLAAGLRAGHIAASPLCTACRTDLFFSHRAEQGDTGRMMGLVGVLYSGRRVAPA